MFRRRVVRDRDVSANVARGPMDVLRLDDAGARVAPSAPMTRQRGRLVRFVEAAYRPRPSVAAWLDELTSEAAALVPESAAVVSRLLELEPRRLHGYMIHSDNADLVRLLRAEEQADALRVDLPHAPS